jgi:hypothetical protein
MWDLWWKKWHGGKVFSEHFGFPCQFPFPRLFHIHRLSSGAGTTGPIVVDVPSGLSLTSLQETKEKELIKHAYLVHEATGYYKFKTRIIIVAELLIAAVTLC